MADMPHHFIFPGGGGEWLFHADEVGFPVDWGVRVRSVPNADAQAKVRRKHRDLVGQVDEYDGELTGAPPQLADAIQAIDEERPQLGANPTEPELQATVLLSLAADDLGRAGGPGGRPRRLVRAPRVRPRPGPTGGQVALLRSMLPGTVGRAGVPRLHPVPAGPRPGRRQPLLRHRRRRPAPASCSASRSTAATARPVLFDPAFGPQANASPSLAAVGRLGSGKSFLLKRLCWDTVARGGQVVTIDRTRSGEYARFAEAVPGRVQVVRLEAGADVCLDPLRTFARRRRGHGDAGLPVAARRVLGPLRGGRGAGRGRRPRRGPRRTPSLGDVARRARLAWARTPRSPTRRPAAWPADWPTTAGRRPGSSPSGEGEPVSLDADFIVFWAPNLALPDRETLLSEHGMRHDAARADPRPGPALPGGRGRPAGRLPRPDAASPPPSTTRRGRCWRRRTGRTC